MKFIGRGGDEGVGWGRPGVDWAGITMFDMFIDLWKR